MKDHTSLVTAARDLRKRIEQQVQAYASAPGAPAIDLQAYLPAGDTATFLRGVEDLADRVTIIERSQRQLLERLEFVSHVTRMLGFEDWSVRDPDPLAPAAQASGIGASGAASPQGSPSPISEGTPS